MTTATTAPAWSGRTVTRARQIVATWLPAPCGQCGEEVQPSPSSGWVVGHTIARSIAPHLANEPANWRPEHRACSDRTGQAAVIEKARLEGARSVSPHATPPGESPPLSAHTHGPRQAEPVVIREGLTWTKIRQDAPAWLRPYLRVPRDATAPLAMTPVHPRAVGSYGPEALRWMEANLRERGQPLRLRWWQRLAIVRQLEHDAEGVLCWKFLVESTPRRAGKSTRLRAVSLWRLAVGPSLFEPDQLVLHTGKDLAIVREVLRKAWPWADAQPGWNTKRGMTEPEVSFEETNRWVARSKDSTTGYDVCLGLVDEAWDVKPDAVDEDLEPAMLERVSPQLLLTSTAHRRATNLMRRRITSALAADDGETLLLLWGAKPDDDPSDPKVWRAASPYWSEDRRRMIASKYEKALAGEADPTADDPDPMQGFVSQYLNVWRLRQPVATRGDEVIGAAAWADLVTDPPFAPPDAAAIESWFSEGVSLALAWKVGDQVVLRATDHPDLASAADALRESGFKRTAVVGSSLIKDPALKGIRKKAGEGRTLAAVQDLQRLLAEDVVRHDGGSHLTEQVLGVRTVPGADGPRLTSKGRADAVKSAVWSLRATRLRLSANSRILLPSSL